ncbi:hypothetical protein NHF50_08135 [Flavobacterium sp. NRK F10]|uniref:hypothetical protein n=1 Tax=Flavobacterium sp. NRK F10 TaxID=2954931 RepID=UPI002091BD2C|nr:hypothetical protein [Flavobacterium sp. NRK F10]MCO6175014.1 hypothetical protein [Flavobacterium sp. NRK F10]
MKTTHTYYLAVVILIFFHQLLDAQTTEATNTISNANSYLGTANDYDILFKRNGIETGKITTNSISLGKNSNAQNYSTSIGYQSGSNSSTNATNNVFIGASAGLFNFTGRNNTFIGSFAGSTNVTGYENVYIGINAGPDDADDAHGNVFIGAYSGFNETGSNKLYISNSDTNLPLIWGDFAEEQLKFNGKVGIGYGFGNYPTTTGTADVSTYNLFVNGGILTEEVRVTLQSTWADYVFKEGYKLPSLEEVEKHIQEKGHLINVPSAEEIETNGIELGEMTKIQQEKIEELTLYLIEQKKVNEEQEKEIKELKNLVQSLLQKVQDSNE